MKRSFLLVVLIAALLVAGTAWAQEPERQDRHWQESPFWGTFGFNIGMLFFDDDGYADVYGEKGVAFYQMAASWKIVHHLELVGNISYGFAEGHGISPQDQSKTAEKYKLHIAPGGLGLLYRFNFGLDQPVVPYAGASGVLSYWFEEKLDSSWKRRSYNYGAQAYGGLMFLLDNLEKRASGALEAEWGINNTYLFYEFRYTNLDNFGEENIVDLSSQFHSLGILFEF
ncbi:MAG: MXAN_2562 family outer membrane beta-barrel protein [Candidatus Lernaella stagnicola]|nr:MXAN_2562 family outer membrane beta-barrel protein [Candidatus Lernaella stagnicola]